MVLQNEENEKNGFLAKLVWHCLCQEGRKTRSFVHTVCFGQKMFWGPKQSKPGKTIIKIVVSAEIAQNRRWHLFFEKGVVWDGWRKCFFTNCVFESSALLKALYSTVFSASTAFAVKNACWQKQKFMKIVGCFWTWQKGVFVCFEGLMVLWFAFCVFGKVAEVLKCLFSLGLGAFLGWLILAHLGLEGLGVLVFFVSLVFVFFLHCDCFVVVFFFFGGGGGLLFLFFEVCSVFLFLFCFC